LRPWVIVVESTLPNTTEQSFDTWEPRLLSADYSLVYSDGLNRFYCRKDKLVLAHAFSVPPHVFDNVRLRPHALMCQDVVASMDARLRKHEATIEELNSMLWGARAELTDLRHSHDGRVVTSLREEVASLRKEAARLSADSAALTGQLAASQAAYCELNHAYQAVRHSFFWRITKPARVLVHALRRLRLLPPAAIDAVSQDQVLQDQTLQEQALQEQAPKASGLKGSSTQPAPTSDGIAEAGPASHAQELSPQASQWLDKLTSHNPESTER